MFACQENTKNLLGLNIPNLKTDFCEKILKDFRHYLLRF